MLSPEVVELLVRSLNDRFKRIEAGCDPSRDDYNGRHLVPALLVYSRPFYEDPLLRSLVRECETDGATTFYEVREIQHRHGVTMGEVAEGILDVARRHDGAALASQVDEIFRNLRLAAEHPEIEYPKIEAALSWLNSMSHQLALDREGPSLHESLYVLREKFNRARHAFEREEDRLTLVRLAKPWRGAEIVRAFGGCPEGQRDLRMTPTEWQTARQVMKWLDIGPKGGFGGDPIETFTQIVHHVGTFHDWVVHRILSTRTTEQVLLRYKERVERFERDEYVSDLRREGEDGNPDETRFKRRLALYLHDAGLDPFTEVETGPSRADGVALRAGRVVVATYEAKVIRPGDGKDAIARRIVDGAFKARRYARYYNQQVGYLVVYWRHDSEPDLGAHIRLPEGSVTPVLIDLRDAPSTSKKIRFTLSDAEVTAIAEEVRRDETGNDQTE